MTSELVDTVDEQVKVPDPKVTEIFETYQKPNISFSYNCLVERILQHPVLENWIKQKVTSNPKIINLITKDWLAVLENNLTIQEYLNRKVEFFKYDSKFNKNICNYRVQTHANNISLIAVGIFKIAEDKENANNFKLKMIECIPVQCIGEIMCLKVEKKVLHNAKFYIRTCNGFCIKCRKYNVASDNIWCIQRSLVYENEKIQYAERKYCTSLYSSEFRAIVHLEINSAYNWADGCKIGGTLESMVFIENIFDFHDTKNVQRLLKADENFVPYEEECENKKAPLKKDEHFMPQPEKEINRTMETINTKRLKNENVESIHEQGMKRKNEDAIENDSKKVLIKNTENTKGDILAIPQGVNYNKPREKSFEVKSSIENMPDT